MELTQTDPNPLPCGCYGRYSDPVVVHCRLHKAAADMFTALEDLIEMITDNRLHGPELVRACDVLAKARGAA